MFFARRFPFVIPKTRQGPILPFSFLDVSKTLHAKHCGIPVTGETLFTRFRVCWLSVWCPYTSFDVIKNAPTCPNNGLLKTIDFIGFGWGMLPDLQLAGAPNGDGGQLVELDPGGATDVVLYWQQWRLHSPALDRVAAAVQEAARVKLDPEIRR